MRPAAGPFGENARAGLAISPAGARPLASGESAAYFGTLESSSPTLALWIHPGLASASAPGGSTAGRIAAKAAGLLWQKRIKFATLALWIHPALDATANRPHISAGLAAQDRPESGANPLTAFPIAIIALTVFADSDRLLRDPRCDLMSLTHEIAGPGLDARPELSPVLAPAGRASKLKTISQRTGNHSETSSNLSFQKPIDS
jgi:hypothetical protein